MSSHRLTITWTCLYTVCVLLTVTVTAQNCHKKFQVFPDHTACTSKSPKATPKGLTDAEKDSIVNKHNDLRSGVIPLATDMLKMTWDDELAMLAQKWADTCPVDGGLKHDSTSARYIPGRFSVGQNMAAGYSDFDSAIQGWYNEVDDYVFGTNKQTKMVGHYTQIVWSSSTKIGCGHTICNGYIVHVCNYGPAGNLAGSKQPYNTGDVRGSLCQTNDTGLCDCKGLVCFNRQTLSTETCTCNCESRYKAPDCSLNCVVNDEFYCGMPEYGYTKENCYSSLAGSINPPCPKMCGICPL